MRIGLAVLGLLATAQLVAAQSRIDELGGFYAVLFTPSGALPAAVRVQPPREGERRLSADFRYCRYQFRDDNVAYDNFGLGARVRVFRSISVGGVVAHRTCGTCDGLSMVGAELSTTLLRRRATEPEGGDSELGLLLNAGAGTPSKLAFSTQSVGALLPVSVTLPQENGALLALSLLPGVGYGRLKDDGGVLFPGVDSLGALTPGPKGTFGSVRFTIGASVAFFAAVGLGLHASVHRIAIAEAPTQVGVTASWRF